MSNGVSDERSWFLIHTKPKQEERAISNLRAWNVETLSPQIRDVSYNPFNGVPRYTVKPLFSRYIFVRFNLERLFHKIRYTRGVQGLVGFGDGPTEVDEEIIDFVRCRIGKDGFVSLGDGIKPGDTVLIQDGVFQNLTGVFEREMKDSDRVEVLLDTVLYRARVRIERGMLRKVSDSPCYA
jgi:transcriptional antiterminator RfaH